MITKDYGDCDIPPENLDDIRAIADVKISELTFEDCPNLLIFPDSFKSYDTNFGSKVVCSVKGDGKLYTNSIVGFIGRNNTHLSIHSRFAEEGNEDFFLHYMLQRRASINLLNLPHPTNEDDVLDLLLYLFPAYLKKAINQGIFKQYTRYDHNDANAKGVINISKHIRNNVPFNGKIYYSTREHSCDNAVTQLIRHTIEFIRKEKNYNFIISGDRDVREAVQQVVDATPSYSSLARREIINRNLRPMVHPYYSEYAPLQRLCLQILRHEELKYGLNHDEIYGVLIDAAWLWEEYLAFLLDGKYVHYLKDGEKKFFLFKGGVQRVIPDYLSQDRSIVADAKYIPLNEKKQFVEEKATAIYYKTIAYMCRFSSKTAFLLYPHPDETTQKKYLTIETEQQGTNGGSIIKLGLRIPSGCKDYSIFCERMRQYEQEFIKQCDPSAL